MKPAGFFIGVQILAALSLFGCGPSAAPSQLPRGYFGPTLPLDQVIDHINANNARVPTLWAHVRYFEANSVDRKTGNEQFVNGDQGTLLYTAPQSIRLTVNKQVADLFIMGSDGQQYWFWQKHDNLFYRGAYANLDKPHTVEIPIRPDLVVEVLGVRPIQSQLTREPVPVLRFNNDADAYTIVWQTHLADRWVAQKEIWYDRRTFLPETVVLFDANGRIMLRAYLSNFVPVESADSAADQRPKVATHFKLFFRKQIRTRSLTWRMSV